MPKKSEYELMPVKPLKELKKEIQKLKNDLKKDDGSAKILTKVLNANLEIKKKIDTMLKEHKRVTDNLKQVVKFFETIETSEESEEAEQKEIIKELRDRTRDISEKINSLNEEIRRHKYFKERLPGGVPVVYRRTR